MYELALVVIALVSIGIILKVTSKLYSVWVWASRKKFFLEKFQEDPLPITSGKEEKIERVLRGNLDIFRLQVIELGILRKEKEFGKHYRKVRHEARRSHWGIAAILIVTSEYNYRNVLPFFDRFLSLSRQLRENLKY